MTEEISDSKLFVIVLTLLPRILWYAIPGAFLGAFLGAVLAAIVRHIDASQRASGKEFGVGDLLLAVILFGAVTYACAWVAGQTIKLVNPSIERIIDRKKYAEPDKVRQAVETVYFSVIVVACFGTALLIIGRGSS